MPAELQAIVEKVKTCAARGRPLRIRGGGTKDFYGQVLHGELLDVRPLAGVVSYGPSELVVTVRGGTRLRELEELLAEVSRQSESSELFYDATRPRAEAVRT